MTRCYMNWKICWGPTPRTFEDLLKDIVSEWTTITRKKEQETGSVSSHMSMVTRANHFAIFVLVKKVSTNSACCGS